VSWDTIKKTLLSNPALHARGIAFGLHRCILLNPGQTLISQEMMARTFEALIGAVQIDGGTEAAKKVITRLGFFGDRIWGMRSA
jgi:ribonuclease-3